MKYLKTLERTEPKKEAEETQEAVEVNEEEVEWRR